MRLDPEKRDYAKLIAQLERLSVLGRKERPKERDWAAETVRTLKAGRLESYDLEEFALGEYEGGLAGREDKRPVWERSRALLALLGEMRAAGVTSPKLKKLGDELAGWTLPA